VTPSDKWRFPDLSGVGCGPGFRSSVSRSTLVVTKASLLSLGVPGESRRSSEPCHVSWNRLWVVGTMSCRSRAGPGLIGHVRNEFRLARGGTRDEIRSFRERPGPRTTTAPISPTRCSAAASGVRAWPGPTVSRPPDLPMRERAEGNLTKRTLKH